LLKDSTCTATLSIWPAFFPGASLDEIYNSEILKILWVKSDFLHPTTRGGQIRTLEMLRCLHSNHEVHYVAFREPGETEGLLRSSEYCTRAYPIDLHLPPKSSWRFRLQILQGLLDPLPGAVGRFRSAAMRETVRRLCSSENFDCIVCDFLLPSINLPTMEGVVLFQHNVETMIWLRRAQNAKNIFARTYLNLQASRMQRLEARMCRAAACVVAVSAVDVETMRDRFGIARVVDVPTGVNVEYFTPPTGAPAPDNDLVFVGSMDWAPNIDAVVYFVKEILPVIRRKRPQCSLTIAGRDPVAEIRQLALQDPFIQVTGTVDDVRPYLWRSAISIVPLRVGGGTRLKIYEAMAARVPMVSTHIGAEGLVAEHPGEIRLADDPRNFAAQCVELLESPALRATVASAAWNLVRERFSWKEVTQQFEAILARVAAPVH
jgi:glycosyltransferase involved in cell wall biosynthesis